MLTFHDMIGFFGAFLVISAYIIVQVNFLFASTVSYPVLNCIGSTMIIFSLSNTWNFPSICIEITWLLVSLYGVYRCLRDKFCLKKKNRDLSIITIFNLLFER